MSVPYWVQDQVFYHIFPDRFYKSERVNGVANLEPWGAYPNFRGFQGGNLRGVIEKFDYLLDLGVTALYFSPIFKSAANHRYHTIDYFKIDPTLGTLEDFRALLDIAHANNMKVILDAVFNHTGRGFFAFNDILENGEQSRYLDWYHVHRFPLDAFSHGKAQNYEAWWGMKDLPKLNISSPAVRKHLMSVTRYWLEQGIDGWRLDVPGEIDDDAFWAEFGRVVKETNPDAYTVGELWELAPKWVDENHFDGLMHYPLRGVLMEMLLGELSVIEFAEKVESFLEIYPRENVHAMYVTLGSHDTRRLFSKLEGHFEKVKLAFFFLFAYPGAPGIYYGDEIGLQGGKDPENRGAFPWQEEETWNHDLRDWVKKLIVARKGSVALRRGGFKRIFVDETQPHYAFVRSFGEEQVLVVINPTESTHQLSISAKELGWCQDCVVRDLLSDARYRVSEDVITVSLPPWGGTMLRSI